MSISPVLRPRPIRVSAEAAGSTASTPVARNTHLRITRRGRAVLSAFIAIPLAFGAVAYGVSSGGVAASSHSASTHFDYVTVQQGQSLWGIAEKIAPSADPRDVITAVMELNSLDSANVTPGERLAIPTQYAH